MTTRLTLHSYLEDSAKRVPDKVAVEDPGSDRSITFRQLDQVSDRVRDWLRAAGVQPGDRVGIYMRKSIDAVASIFGILKCGAAYVPVDAGAPVARNAYILSDCSVKAVLLEDHFADALMAPLGERGPFPRLLTIDREGVERDGQPLEQALNRENTNSPFPVTETVFANPDDLAYILYTSGSTGKPKGVMLSHQCGASYVNWCSGIFEPSETDRFSSHAPFHFDLSILDLYLSVKHGATLVLIGEETGKQPLQLAPLIANQKISIWYSAPSILSALAEYGQMHKYDYSSLRTVIFAGEVFPVKHLRKLKSLLPHPRYWNLYGPTETNVCTFYEIPSEIPEARTEPYPIGKTCSHLCSIVVDEQGQRVVPGREGELCISGPGVMQGYWNLPERSAAAFLELDGQRWYKTGDLVVEGTDGNLILIGRRDRMVKRRGYRIELGEIEAGLYRHPAIREAAVIALSDENGVKIKAFITCRDAECPSVVELKRFCAENLPIYMVPDTFVFQNSLPKTSTDKVNYQQLQEFA